MKTKTLQFILTEQETFVKKGETKKMQVAKPTGRRRVEFRGFCERVSKSTSFTWQEIGAVLNLAIEIAKDIVSEGDIVVFGDLGTLKPSFKSKAVPLNEKFRAQDHILTPKVNVVPNRKYFALDGVSYEQVKPLKEQKAAEGKPNSSPKETPSSSSGTL